MVKTIIEKENMKKLVSLMSVLLLVGCGGGGGLNQNNNVTYSRPIGQTYGGYGGLGGGGAGTTKGWTSSNVGEGTAQVSPTAGTPNTGGGGGGTDPELSTNAGGGTGIVIISYLL